MDTTRSNYTVMARRYRPQQFRDVVGQQSVAQALRNAIQSGRVAHAYLFTGARGVGKTSMARILAKALNCPNSVEAEPCNQCDICQGISSGQDVDILEIDGASNRGIDDIRQLRQNVTVKSMRSKYKMYIIDEVHMLTKDAFNALLKTLEEPPPFVKFVFCTTEPNKLPDTILSRCQRFDFGTIETLQIAERLSWIADQEGVVVFPEAIELVARRARGSLRDSQSLFDQLLAYGQKEISAVDVHQLLGTAPDERLIELGNSLVNRQPAQALALTNKVLSEGTQIGEFLNQLVDYVRDLMILAAGAHNLQLGSVSDSRRDVLDVQAKSWGLHTVLAALQILTETQLKFARVLSGRSLLDLAIVRLSLLDELDDLGKLTQMLLDPSAGQGAGDTTPKGQPRSGDSSPQKRPLELRPGRPSSPPRSLSTPSPGGLASALDRSEPADAGTSTGRLENETQRAIPPDSEGNLSPASIPIRSMGIENQSSSGEQRSNPGRVFQPLQPGMEAEILSEIYSTTGDMVRTHLLRAVSTAIIGPNALEIRFPKSYTLSKQYCERPEIVSQLEKVLAQRTGKPSHVRFVQVDTGPATSTAVKTPPKSLGKTTRNLNDIPLDNFVKSVQHTFGATLIDVQSVDRSPSNADSGQEVEHV
ncbi:MAG: DNA polymerase III subunit gamma/tau [Planctomycetota bacterium]|nr:DNA polymerase III subunit gamma/tau [Planctomycetota bacterium]MDA1213128.1 DNA polymerase III subunit gamma/tau [Planctomycetota bacterium]